MTDITELRRVLQRELDELPPAAGQPLPDELIRRAGRRHRMGRAVRFGAVAIVSILVVAGIVLPLRAMWPLADDHVVPAAQSPPPSESSPSMSDTVAVRLTFDGKTCTYDGPKELEAGSWVDVTSVSAEGEKAAWFAWWVSHGVTGPEALHTGGRWSDPPSEIVSGFTYSSSGGGLGGDNPWLAISEGERLVFGCVGEQRAGYPAALVKVVGSVQG